MLKVGLVGVGGISGAHIPGWEKNENIELVAICDIRPEQMEKYPEYRHYTDFLEMLSNEKLDILDICLPTYLHAEFAIKAMEKGINVICEKPISLIKEDVRKIYKTAEENNVKFMVAQVIRFWPEYEYVKECFDNGRYGKLMSGVMQRLSAMPGWSWDGWMKDVKRSGLVPFDLHIHDIDYAVWAFGKPKSATMKRAKSDEQDYLSAIYDFGKYFITIESSWYVGKNYPFSMQFRFQFEKAIMVFENNELIIYDDEGNTINCSASESDGTGDIGLPKTDAYGNEIRYFTDCVLNNKPVEKVKEEELETVIEWLKKF